MRWLPLKMKGAALNAIGRHDEAIEYCRQACQFHAAGFLPATHLAGALAEAGQINAARAAAENAMQLQLALSIEFRRDQFTPMNESALKTLLDRLRKRVCRNRDWQFATCPLLVEERAELIQN